jgi:hypothetical protein
MITYFFWFVEASPHRRPLAPARARARRAATCFPRLWQISSKSILIGSWVEVTCHHRFKKQWHVVIEVLLMREKRVMSPSGIYFRI